MTREEKRQARIERYQQYAANAKNASSAAFKRSHDMASVIPMGQPVHGASDRRYRDRIWEKMGQSVELSKKAEYWADKAEAAENNNAIYLEDSDSVIRLQDKVNKLTALQEKYKAANKICKSKKLANEEKSVQLVKLLSITQTQAQNLLTPDRCNRIGFASYILTNNNANIRNTQKQLDRAIALKNAEEKEYTIKDVRVFENPQENRLQLFFDGKPNEETRKQLKTNGFRWSPSNSAWQSYLNRWQIDRAKRILEAL